jgi:hypothetical protein
MNKILHEVRFDSLRLPESALEAAKVWWPKYQSLADKLGSLGTIIEHKVYQEEYPEPRIIRASEGVGYPRQPVRRTANMTEGRDIGERHLIDTVQTYRGTSAFMGQTLLRYNAEPGSLIVGLEIVDGRDQLPDAVFKAIARVFEARPTT